MKSIVYLLFLQCMSLTLHADIQSEVNEIKASLKFRHTSIGMPKEEKGILPHLSASYSRPESRKDQLMLIEYKPDGWEGITFVEFYARDGVVEMIHTYSMDEKTIRPINDRKLYFRDSKIIKGLELLKSDSEAKKLIQDFSEFYRLVMDRDKLKKS